MGRMEITARMERKRIMKIMKRMERMRRMGSMERLQIIQLMGRHSYDCNIEKHGNNVKNLKYCKG